MQKLKKEDPAHSRLSGRRVPEDLAAINGGFTDYLRSCGYATLTVTHYCQRLRKISRWLGTRRRRRSLDTLCRRSIRGVLADFIPDGAGEAVFNYRKVLHHWLRFRGTFRKSASTVAWDNRGWLTMSPFSRHTAVLDRRVSSTRSGTSERFFDGSSAVERPIGRQ